MEGVPQPIIPSNMQGVDELERLAQLASQQARMTTNPEARDVLLDLARKFTDAANEHRAALAEIRQCGDRQPS